MKGEEGVEYVQKWERPTISIEITTDMATMCPRDWIWCFTLYFLGCIAMTSTAPLVLLSGKWHVLELTITTGNDHLVRGPWSLVQL